MNLTGTLDNKESEKGKNKQIMFACNKLRDFTIQLTMSLVIQKGWHREIESYLNERIRQLSFKRNMNISKVVILLSRHNKPWKKIRKKKSLTWTFKTWTCLIFM